MAKKIHLAVPYSHPAPNVRQMRFEAVNRVAAILIKEGNLVYSPISHTHPIEVRGELPSDWEFWKPLCETFIEWCDEIHILKLTGWEQSVGIAGEIEIGTHLNKTIEFIQNTCRICGCTEQRACLGGCYWIQSDLCSE